MKSILLLTCFLILAVASYSQQNHRPELNSREYYLQKCRNQRTAGYLLLGVGAAAITIPIVIYENDPDRALDSALGPFTILIGIVMVVASVPILNSSDINKRKAMSLSLKNETTPYIQNGSYLTKGVPSLTLKIGL